MQKLAKNRLIFISCSCLGIACLVGAFSHPLQKMEVWRSKESSNYDIGYARHFILTESDDGYPFGFNSDNAVRVREIYQDYKFEKFSFLVLAVLFSGIALSLGSETCLGSEIDSEVNRIESEGKKQLIIESIKHRLAMASKSQRLLFMDEMKTLIEEFGSVEGEILEIDEINETDKFTNANYLLADGVDIDSVITQVWGYVLGSKEHSEMKERFLKWLDDGELGKAEVEKINFRNIFPEEMDKSSWKAVLKALGDDLTASEIVNGVLGCGESQKAEGNAYLEYLKNKFLGG